MEVYERTVATLQPEVDKMRAFLNFHRRAVDDVCRITEQLVQTHVKPKRDLYALPEQLVLSIAR